MLKSVRSSPFSALIVTYLISFGFIYLAYFSVNYTARFLFISFLLLWVGVWIFIESLVRTFGLISKRTKIKQRTTLIHVRIWIVVFMGLEILLRGTGSFLTHPEISDGRYISNAKQNHIPSWYWLHPSKDTVVNHRKEFKFYRTTNSIGLSEKEIFRTKSAKTRLIALGDSFTEGVGVEQDAGWVRQVEKNFTSFGNSLETINAGIGGSDPVFEYKLFTDKLLDYKPDVLILTINGTDIFDIVARGGNKRFNTDGSSGASVPWWDWIYACSHLTRFYTHKLLKYPVPFVGVAHVTEEQASQIIIQTIKNFKTLCQVQKVKFMVILQPSLHEFKGSSYIPFYGYKVLISTMEESQIEHLELYSELIRESKKSRRKIQSYYWPIDTHFNAAGYQCFAKSVTAKLKSLNWIE